MLGTMVLAGMSLLSVLVMGALLWEHADPANKLAPVPVKAPRRR